MTALALSTGHVYPSRGPPACLLPRGRGRNLSTQALEWRGASPGRVLVSGDLQGHWVWWYPAPHILCAGSSWAGEPLLCVRGTFPWRVLCVSPVHGSDPCAPLTSPHSPGRAVRSNRRPRRPHACTRSGKNLSYRASALLCASPVLLGHTPCHHRTGEMRLREATAVA